MKTLLLPFFILTVTCEALGQVQLCEEKATMYSSCYQLDTNGTFVYYYAHCTGISYGKGRVIKGNRSITFLFDSIQSPIIQGTWDTLETSKIQIELKHVVDNIPMDYININYKGMQYVTDSLGIVTLNYRGGIIEIQSYSGREKITLNPESDSSNRYSILWHSEWDAFIHHDKVKMIKKAGKKYVYRTTAKRYDEDSQEFKDYKKEIIYVVR